MRSHLMPVRVALMNQQTARVDEDVEKREPLCTLGGNADWYSPYGRLWRFLNKLKMELPYDPAIPLLGIYLRKPKTLIQRNMCTPYVHCRVIYNS